MFVYRGCGLPETKHIVGPVNCDLEKEKCVMEELNSEKQTEDITWLSRWVKILVKMKFIPLKIRKGGDPTFSLCSVETLASFFLYYFSSVSLFSLCIFFFRASLNTNKTKKLKEKKI